ncbi:MAG: hypothetical protein RSJ40_08750 [Acetivibrio sp.]
MYKKRKIKAFFGILFLMLLFCPTMAKAEEVTKVYDLIEHAKAYDEQRITLFGEAIGEPLKREYTWVNINDGSSAIGVWMKTAEADSIEKYGNYKTKGDVIKVQGIFHRACTQHGGEADIHNVSFVITEKGTSIVRTLAPAKIVTCAILFVIAGFFAFLYYYKRKKLSF